MDEHNLHTPEDHQPHWQMKKGLLDSLEPKTAFISGLATGVLGLCTIGFFALLVMMAQGKLPNWKSAAAAATDTVATAPATQPNAPAEPTAGPVPPVTDKDHVFGPANAKVTLIEYSDLECPYCKQFHPTLQKLVAEYPNDVRWVFRHFPLESIHPNARKEAEASECVAEVGGNAKFWQFINTLIERSRAGGTGFALDDLPKLAKEIGVNEGKYNECMKANRGSAKVDAQFQGGVGAGVQGTPGSFINGRAVSGVVPYEQLKSLVESNLK